MYLVGTYLPHLPNEINRDAQLKRLAPRGSVSTLQRREQLPLTELRRAIRSSQRQKGIRTDCFTERFQFPLSSATHGFSL